MAKKKKMGEMTSDDGATVDREGLEPDAGNADPPEPDAPSEDPKVTLKKACATWEEQTRTIAEIGADREKTEVTIAAALVAIGTGQRSQPTIKLGGNPHKARRSKDGGAPKLVKLGDFADVSLD